MNPALKRALLAFVLALIVRDACGGEAGLFVAVGYGGRRMTSHDGISWENDQRWSDESSDDDNLLCSVAFGLKRFIAVGGGTQTGHILATRDGRDWQPVQPMQGRVSTIAFGNGRFVATHDAELMFSTTGEKFETGSKLDMKGSVHARRSACGDTEAGFRFVIIGDVDVWTPEKKRLSWRGVTSDGTRWEHTALETPAAQDIAYGAGHFVVVGPNGLVESSHDGEAWQKHDVEPTENFTHIVWTGARFLVGGGQAVWTSPDGLAWTKQPQPLPCSVLWAREHMLGLGVLWGGNVFYSHDLVEWKKSTIPPGPSLTAFTYGQP